MIKKRIKFLDLYNTKQEVYFIVILGHPCIISLSKSEVGLKILFQL